MRFHVVPILRIFDEAMAREFYLGYLGMSIDWGHRFEEGLPVYMQVSRGAFVLHLTGHAGDCTPGAKVFVNTPDLEPLYAELLARGSRFTAPAIERAPWGQRGFEVVDPFANRIYFNEEPTSVG